MMNSDGPILKAVQINKQYPGVKALNNVEFELQQGEVRALLGKNGAGKSTLVKILSGAITPDSGEIYINGELITIRSPGDAFEAGIAMVYQEMSLVKGLTVAENILMGRWPHRKFLGISVIQKQQVLKQAREALDLMGVELDLNQIISRLSVPEQQMVEIAKAVSFQPKVLILDEPTSSLPQVEVDHLLELVRNLAANGVSIIYVSHRLQEIPRVADSLTVLRDGELIGTIPVSEASPERIANMMIGSALTKTHVETVHSDEEKNVRLSVRNLSRSKYLYDVSFDLYEGEVLGIAGLLGSGRTEILRSIFGLDHFDSGSISIEGEEISHPTPTVMKSRGIGLTPEDRKAQGLVLIMNVGDNLTLSCAERVSNYQVIFPKKKRQLAEEMVNVLDIQTPSLEVKTLSLSGGNQQKVVIGKWLNAQVKILMMDEPTRGIDIHAKEQVYKLVRDLAKSGISVIFVSSEIEEVLSVSDRVLVINQGRIIAEMPSREAELEQVLALTMKEEVV
ncbi:MAG: sugar ABC transporter ATP-binding protein [Anaerolineales bacterium]|nr:sugar ABC transporter ATP-binding protein [Anaerolineales bacterium]